MQQKKKRENIKKRKVFEIENETLNLYSFNLTLSHKVRASNFVRKSIKTLKRAAWLPSIIYRDKIVSRISTSGRCFSCK